ncbi:MAG: D-inositol-3-phosphate glycosyltransferase [Anaerolineales bacterium]|nr:D-inositol-3-phosphate glycosyltransferase [Anaerolineales bacterium]
MPRDIVVNGRFLARRVTGVERYAHEITKILKSRCRIETTRFNGIAGHAWEQLILPTKLNRDSILWSPANSGPLIVRNQALTIHDLSPLEHPEWFAETYSAWSRLLLPMLARRVRVIFVPSNYVKEKVTTRFGVENIVVAPNGVDTAIFHPSAKQGALDFPKKYILFVGSIQPRKNLAGLMRAWHEVKDEFNDTWLVVAGAAGGVFRSVKFSSDERVRFLGYVPDERLPALYANAELFVLPSFDEGFGLPALEAMACGTPVIVSNGGALPEVAGDAGFIFDLSTPATLAQGLRECLSDEKLRAALIEKGLARAKQFSWQASAELIWKTLNEI